MFNKHFRFATLGLSALFILLALAYAAPVHAATTTVYDWVWEQPTAQGNDLTGVHCLSETFCKALVITGDILSWDGTRWNADASGTTTQLNGVFCATTTLCKAVGNGGILRTWDGNIWSADTSPTPNNLYGIACPSTMLCKAVGESGTLLTWNGTAWSAETSGTPQSLNGVACPLTTYCKAVGNGGTVLSWNNGVWGGDTSNTTQNIHGVTCLSGVFCKAIGFGGAILSWNGTTWSVETIGPYGYGISCASTTYCRVVGYSTKSWNGSTWGAFPASCALCIPRFYSAISCLTTTIYCKLVGPSGTIVTARPGLTTESRGSENDRAGISCPSTTVCKAVSTWFAAYIRSWNGTTWSEQSMLGGDNNVNDVACPTTTLCKAVGNENSTINERNRISSWDGSSWVQEVSDSYDKLNAVSCPTETLCKAVGVNGFVRSWYGGTWTAEGSGTTNELMGVACLDATFCKAVGVNGTVRNWNGTSWSADTSGVTVSLNDVSCVSTTFCKAVGNSGTLLTWNGTGWSAETVAAVNLNGIGCPTTTWCKVAGDGGTILGWNGTSWSAETSGTSNNLQDVECLSTTQCKIAGAFGAILSMVVQTLNDVSAGFALNVFNGNGCLTGITVTEYQTNHPNATTDLQNGRYWNITPSGCTSGFSATVTFTTTFTPNNSAYACRYTGSAWSCANNGFTTNPDTVTRVAVTEFSDWAAGTNAPTSATLTMFGAKAKTGKTGKQVVRVKWETGSELNVVGFNLYRATKKNGAYKLLNKELIAAKHPGEILGANYSYTNKKVKAGKTYFYKLEIVLADGTSEWSEAEKVRVP